MRTCIYQFFVILRESIPSLGLFSNLITSIVYDYQVNKHKNEFLKGEFLFYIGLPLPKFGEWDVNDPA
jgi:hypothetical protein